MGTNFYLKTKNKELVHKYFEGEYDYSEEPSLCYCIHICKKSCGWKPLFQIHKDAFSTFKEFEKFFKSSKIDSCFEIYDEYGDQYTFEFFKKSVVNHSNIGKKPMKWVYKNNPIFNPDGRKSLDTEECREEEAELYIPFSHGLYQKTYQAARRKFHDIPLFDINRDYSALDPVYIEDPDYNFDWTEGEFS